MNNKILMIVNEDRFFLSHRKDVAVAAKEHGYDVTIVCKDTGRMQEVRDLGLRVIELPVNPTGMNLREEMRTLRFLYKLYRKERPAIVHHVGLKSILWGGLAARFAKVPGVVNAVSGLGVMFNGEKPSLTAEAMLRVMRFANRGMHVSELFQNQEDRALLLSRKVIKEEDCDFIKGSGVSLDEYSFMPEPTEGKIRVMFTARMVREKGMYTLIEAAEMLRADYADKVEFLLCGGLSNNPAAVRKEELEAMCDGKYLQWLGHRSDVRDLLQKSHIVAFPSYYREGVPRSLIEACATGRPIVTCNSIGCKDTVDDGVNGFLIEPRNSKALADRLRQLFDDPELRVRMGEKGREKAVAEFSIENVVGKHLAIYDRLTVK